MTWMSTLTFMLCKSEYEGFILRLIIGGYETEFEGLLQHHLVGLSNMTLASHPFRLENKPSM